MSAEIINLRRARKSKARTDKEQQAAENRANFGRTKNERLTEQEQNQRQADSLDQRKLEPSKTDEVKPTKPERP